MRLDVLDDKARHSFFLCLSVDTPSRTDYSLQKFQLQECRLTNKQAHGKHQ